MEIVKVYWNVDNRLQSINPIITALAAISKEVVVVNRLLGPWSVEYCRRMGIFG